MRVLWSHSASSFSREQSSGLARQLELSDEEVASLWWQAMQGGNKSPAGCRRAASRQKNIAAVSATDRIRRTTES
jgi:hypothetical protein